jgi:hypothetical protein
MLTEVKGIRDDMDISERADLNHDPEPIYMARLLPALSKLKNEDRLAWLKKAYAFHAPDGDGP